MVPMNSILRFARTVFPGATLLAVIGMSLQALAEPTQQHATVLAVNGDASYSSDNKAWQPLKVGDTLKAGDVVQTATGSEVDLRLGGGPGSANAPSQGADDRSGEPASIYKGAIGGGDEGAAAGGGAYTPEEPDANIVRVQQDSVLAIDKLTADKINPDTVEETQLDLREGSIVGCNRKTSGASKCDVKTRCGKDHIHSSFYFVSSSGVVNVVTGSVTVTTVSPKGTTEVTVKAGTSYNPLTGETTQIDPKLLKKLVKIVKEFHLESPPIAYNPPGAPSTTVYVTPNFPDHDKDGHHQKGDHDDHHDEGDNHGGDHSGGDGGDHHSSGDGGHG
jgi:hypothetical protein